MSVHRMEPMALSSELSEVSCSNVATYEHAVDALAPPRDSARKPHVVANVVVTGFKTPIGSCEAVCFGYSGLLRPRAECPRRL